MTSLNPNGGTQGDYLGQKFSHRVLENCLFFSVNFVRRSVILEHVNRSIVFFTMYLSLVKCNIWKAHHLCKCTKDVLMILLVFTELRYFSQMKTEGVTTQVKALDKHILLLWYYQGETFRFLFWPSNISITVKQLKRITSFTDRSRRSRIWETFVWEDLR